MFLQGPLFSLSFLLVVPSAGSLLTSTDFSPSLPNRSHRQHNQHHPHLIFYCESLSSSLSYHAEILTPKGSGIKEAGPSGRAYIVMAGAFMGGISALGKVVLGLPCPRALCEAPQEVGSCILEEGSHQTQSVLAS